VKLLQTSLKWILYPLVRRIIAMPGRNHVGPLPAFTDAERQIRDNLHRHVSALAVDIGERSVRSGLNEAADYCKRSLTALGYAVSEHEFELDGRTYRNIETEIKGTSRPDEVLVIGAHYDSQFNTPGADDNASGVAALFEIARLLKDSKPARTVRLVAFTNEEHPLNVEAWASMGSWFYAKRSHDRKENIVGMLSLEMLAVYSDAEGSQQYPAPFHLFYPTVGNFIGFVGNSSSRDLVHKCIGSFRSHTAFPSEGTAAPDFIKDIGRSDHWSFWQFGWQAVMVTDTSNFRYPLYHTPGDTIDKLDFERFARVTAGLARTVDALANG